MDENKKISGILIEWYFKNKRDLPWRNTNDPYKIWISEIILQQTRVAQGLAYYDRFMNRFPDIKSLAMAQEEEVLKHWEGLGYYSRARNLHYTAKDIQENHQGIFPNDYKTILNLKGIGEYTAAAISSFAWGFPYPTVDGNVFRFLSRLLAINEPIDTLRGKKYFTKIAQEIMDKEAAVYFNQAIMEFGALQCTPTSPDCSICPFNSMCMAYSFHKIAEYPVKKNKRKTKDIYINYFHIYDDNHLLIHKREKNGIWKNLYEFPSIESENVTNFEDLINTPQFKLWFSEKNRQMFQCVIEKQKHVLSHRILHVTFYRVYIDKGIKDTFNFKKIKSKDIHLYPVHRLMQHYIQNNLTE